MLVLTRLAGQAITIGPDVEIRIIGMSGKQVRIGIDAPKSTVILRSELNLQSADVLQRYRNLSHVRR